MPMFQINTKPNICSCLTHQNVLRTRLQRSLVSCFWPNKSVIIPSTCVLNFCCLKEQQKNGHHTLVQSLAIAAPIQYLDAPLSESNMRNIHRYDFENRLFNRENLVSKIKPLYYGRHHNSSKMGTVLKYAQKCINANRVKDKCI